LRRHCADLNSKLAAAVERALAYDAINRPRDAAELKQHLLEAKAQLSEPWKPGPSFSSYPTALTSIPIDPDPGPTDQWTGARYPRKHRGYFSKPGIK